MYLHYFYSFVEGVPFLFKVTKLIIHLIILSLWKVCHLDSTEIVYATYHVFNLFSYTFFVEGMSPGLYGDRVRHVPRGRRRDALLHRRRLRQGQDCHQHPGHALNAGGNQ